MTKRNDPFPVTKQGLDEINEKLTFLKSVRREELSIKLATAIAQGDLKENADYHAAKEEQGFVEGEVRDLEDKLRRATIIKKTGSSEYVQVGSTVTIHDEEFDEDLTYYIVGPHEADPANGRISNESPYGKALLGAKEGQTVKVSTPGGLINLRVQTIE